MGAPCFWGGGLKVTRQLVSRRSAGSASLLQTTIVPVGMFSLKSEACVRTQPGRCLATEVEVWRRKAEGFGIKPTPAQFICPLITT